MAILLKIFWKKSLFFFLAILTFFMAALDAQRNFMPTRYIFFLSISFGSKVIAFPVFPVPGSFGGLCYTTWQLCCGNNSNDLGIGLDI